MHSQCDLMALNIGINEYLGINEFSMNTKCSCVSQPGFHCIQTSNISACFDHSLFSIQLNFIKHSNHCSCLKVLNKGHKNTYTLITNSDDVHY